MALTSLSHHTPQRAHAGLPHLRMAVGVLHAGAAECDAMEHGHIVTDDRRFPHNDAGAMIDEHSFAKLGARVNVYLKFLIHLFFFTGKRQFVETTRTRMYVHAPTGRGRVGDGMRASSLNRERPGDETTRDFIYKPERRGRAE